MYWKNNFYMADELLVSFSLYKNGLQLISMKQLNNSSEIHAAHGIRFLNAFMLIISHKSLALFFIPYVNRTAMVEVSIINEIYKVNVFVNTINELLKLV